MARIARVTAQGYPPSDMEFLLRHEGLLDRRLVPGKPDRPPKKGQCILCPPITGRGLSKDCVLHLWQAGRKTKSSLGTRH